MLRCWALGRIVVGALCGSALMKCDQVIYIIRLYISLKVVTSCHASYISRNMGFLLSDSETSCADDQWRLCRQPSNTLYTLSQESSKASEDLMRQSFSCVRTSVQHRERLKYPSGKTEVHSAGWPWACNFDWSSYPRRQPQLKRYFISFWPGHISWTSGLDMAGVHGRAILVDKYGG